MPAPSPIACTTPVARALLGLAVATLLACSFDATGLGDEVGGAPTPGLTNATVDPTSDAPASSTGDEPDGSGSATGTGDVSGTSMSDATTATTATTVTTEPPASCGDDMPDPGEDCDAGPNNQGGKACTPQCTSNVCGDGYLGLGEACDPGPDPQNGQACTPGCTVNTCGDGYLGAGETCDDGPNNGVDKMCTDACTAAKCGDGKVGPGEGCDDSNTNNNDGCLNTCQLATCGDGILQQGLEDCDGGPNNGMYGSPCNVTCDGAGPKCGDGKWDVGPEQCDGGDRPAGVTCDASCKATCTAKHADCNANIGDGCENLQVDKNNCGMCSKVCAGPGNFCFQSSCVY